MVLELNLISLMRSCMPTWNSFNAFVVGRSAFRVGGASAVGNPNVSLDSFPALVGLFILCTFHFIFLSVASQLEMYFSKITLSSGTGTYVLKTVP